MDTDNIRQLLDRYYDGQTSEREEQELKDYFLQDDVLPQWATDQRLFRQLYGADMPASDGMEQRLSRQIDSWNRVEKTAGRHARAVGLRWIAGIAASLLLLFAIGLLADRQQKQAQYAAQQDTFDDPRDAYAETQKALMMFSKSINKGLNKVENVTQE